MLWSDPFVIDLSCYNFSTMWRVLPRDGPCELTPRHPARSLATGRTAGPPARSRDRNSVPTAAPARPERVWSFEASWDRLRPEPQRRPTTPNAFAGRADTMRQWRREGIPIHPMSRAATRARAGLGGAFRSLRVARREGRGP